MPEMHLRQPRLTYTDSGSFAINKEGIQKLRETGYSIYIYQRELDKAFFQHDLVYADFKYLPTKTSSDELFIDKIGKLAKLGIIWEKCLQKGTLCNWSEQAFVTNKS